MSVSVSVSVPIFHNAGTDSAYLLPVLLATATFLPKPPRYSYYYTLSSTAQRVAPYAISVPHIAEQPCLLCTAYAMSGTDVLYLATVCYESARTLRDARYCLAYDAMLCPVLRQRMVLRQGRMFMSLFLVVIIAVLPNQVRTRRA
eukprot:522112-Rhodomonas_salina.2